MAHKYKYAYRLEVNKGWMLSLRVASARLGKSIKQFIIEAVNEKIGRDGK